MGYNDDAAEQVVRMSLEGMEVVAKVSGNMTKDAAVLLAAALKEEQTSGKSTIHRLIQSGKELTVFSLPENDIEKFTNVAKKYGVLYAFIKDENNDKSVDIMTRAEDAAKINRIIEKFSLASVKDKSDERNPLKKSPKDQSEKHSDKMADTMKDSNKESVKEKLDNYSEKVKKEKAKHRNRERGERWIFQMMYSYIF